MHALEVLASLVKVAGPALSVLSAAGSDTELSAIAPQLGAALAGLKPAEASDLVCKLLSGTRAFVKDKAGASRLVELNSQDKINTVFSGRLKVMFQVVAHAIRTNFGDFAQGSDQTAPSAPVVAE